MFGLQKNQCGFAVYDAAAPGFCVKKRIFLLKDIGKA